MRHPRACARLLPVAAALALALGAGTTGASEPALDAKAEVRLVDGTRLVGRVLSETESLLVLESELLGRLTIDREHVVSITPLEVPEPAPVQPRPPDAKPDWRLDPDRNSILLGPTPETLPSGTGYFRNFELIVLNFGFAPSDDFNLSFGTLFPVSSSLLSISAGFKWRLTSREKHGVGFAVAANGTLVENEQLGAIIGIVGIGNARSSLNLSVHRTVSSGGDATFFIIGGDVQAGNGFKLLAEYANSTDAVLEDEDFNGFLNLGFRIFGEQSSFSLTGFRPLEETGDSFIAFPLAMYSRHF